MNAYDYFARDAAKPVGIPLVDDAPPVVPDEPEETAAPTPLRIGRLLCGAVKLIDCAIIGAVVLTYLQMPNDSRPSSGWEFPLGVGAVALLLGITMMVCRLARASEEGR
jgi:hypothetical protein